MEIHETGALFEDVQLLPVFPDSKTFPDCSPKKDLEQICRDYDQQKKESGFNLKEFVLANFDLPIAHDSQFKTNTSQTASAHIQSLWDVLTRQPLVNNTGSLISLPKPYIVPGGRFGEIYYWDSYFTMLGLKLSGREDLIESMVENFAWLIEKIGYIPNGNRTYYLGRSQPPFFSLMVDLLSQVSGDKILLKYHKALETEYRFWMKGSELVNPTNSTTHRVVMLEDGSILNRYWDENDTPRPEAFKEDLELSHQSATPKKELFRHIRAAAESGWDFSSRWFKDANSFSSIHTTELIPVDLNCLLWHSEKLLSRINSLLGNTTEANQYDTRAHKRLTAINKYCWSSSESFYFDYDFIVGRRSHHYTLAATFPLFFQLADKKQADAVCSILKEKFLQTGGLATTLVKSGQQWDAPNGWAPLQWIGYVGCKNYNHEVLAEEIRQSWCGTNEKVFKATGKMMEKYSVYGSGEAGGGGEYPNQDGFGWTNGVYLAMVPPKPHPTNS